jgi:hypothetical protein
MKRLVRRTWKHLAEERIVDVKPTIPLGDAFWPLTRAGRRDIDGLFEQEDVRKLVTMLQSRSDGAAVEVMDATYWMKGCSSLGRVRFAALLKVGKKKSSLCLTDIKEAVRALAPRARGALMPRDTPNAWSPELQFLRDNWLSNHVFKSYDDLVDHCCAAWNRLIDQPCRIMSIGLRQWAHGVLINGIRYNAPSADLKRIVL